MSNSTKLPKQPQENLQNYAAETHTHKESSPSKITSRALDNSPFLIIGDQEEGYFLALGKYRISEHFNTPEEVITYTKKEFNWELLTTVMLTITQIAKEHELLNKPLIGQTPDLRDGAHMI